MEQKSRLKSTSPNHTVGFGPKCVRGLDSGDTSPDLQCIHPPRRTFPDAVKKLCGEHPALTLEVRR